MSDVALVTTTLSQSVATTLLTGDARQLIFNFNIFNIFIHTPEVNKDQDVVSIEEFNIVAP